MESQLKTVKRQRSENWLEEDKIILKELIRERVLIIENKNTDANTNTKKVAAWNNLLSSFNSMARSTRTLQQIKAQWGIMKMAEKKKKCLERKERLQTGGGPPPITNPPSGDDIAAWLPHEFTIDTNEFDSDNQPLTYKNIEKSEVNSRLVCDNPVPESDMVLEPGTSIMSEYKKATVNLSISQPSTSMTMTTSPPPITNIPTLKKSPNYKLKNKQINKNIRNSPAQQVAEMEIACRKEVHEAEMANQKQKLKNLLLKEEVLKAKLLYYKNKLN